KVSMDLEVKSYRFSNPVLIKIAHFLEKVVQFSKKQAYTSSNLIGVNRGWGAMKRHQRTLFDPKLFLTKVGEGRTGRNCRKNEIIFAQGDPADAVFYIHDGRVKLTVISEVGKEAVFAVLGAGNFFGESCLTSQASRMATATAVTACSITRIEKPVMVRVIHDEPAFSELFIAHLLSRNIRLEEDLVDQLFNSSEKRLARILLLLANFGKEDTPE